MRITDGTDVTTVDLSTGNLLTRRTRPTRRQIGRALLNTLMSAAGFAVCVVGPAAMGPPATWIPATWTQPSRTVARPWIMVGVLLVVHVIGTIRIVFANPDLLPERARVGRQPGQPIADKVLLLAFTISYVAMLIVSSADASRWHVWPAPAAVGSWRAGSWAAISWMVISYAGLAIFAAGWWLVLRALETNAFAVRVVRHQPERGHRVIDTGVYRIVRHPMYAGLVGVMIGAPLWLGSTLGLLLAAVPIGILAMRILLEERMLRERVPGYVQYTQRVPRRLIPGVW